MSVKYPKIPYSDTRNISKEHYYVLSDMFVRYKEIRGELQIEKNQLDVEKMVSYDYESHEIKAKFKDLIIRNANNEHDILFLENYPSIAVRHFLGESWGTTSPR